MDNQENCGNCGKAYSEVGQGIFDFTCVHCNELTLSLRSSRQITGEIRCEKKKSYQNY